MPYLQLAEQNAVSVVWAGMPGDTPRVAVARANDSTRTVISSVVARHPASEKIALAQRKELLEEMFDDEDSDEVDDDDEREPEPEDFYELAARVDGLQLGQHHCYRLDSDRGPLTEWATLTTAPAADPKRVDRFIVLGDSGSGQPAQRALAQQFARSPMDAILFLGDIAYYSGTHNQLQTRFFDVYAEIFQRVPVYAAIGNHDRRSAGGQPFYEALLLPGKETWYSFDAGDVHFIVLDTTRIGFEQASWLDRDLARVTRRFTVVLGHHPPYTSGWHDIPDTIARNASDGVAAFARIYFGIAVLVGGILGLSLGNAVFVDQMMADNTEEVERDVTDMTHEVSLLRQEIRELRALIIERGASH